MTAAEITLNQVAIREDYTNYGPPKLSFSTKTLDPTYSKLVFENAKKGLYNVRNDAIILDTAYDEIYDASFKGIHANGYVLKNEGVYSVKLFNFSGKVCEVSGSFNHMPYVSFFEYGSPEVHIISMFDAQGQFMYYANQNGTLFYSGD